MLGDGLVDGCLDLPFVRDVGAREGTAFRPCSSFMSRIATLAPAFAKRRAQASPMPLAPPVTRTDLPLMSMTWLPEASPPGS